MTSRYRAIAKRWQRVQLAEIRARKTRTKVDRAIYWAARWDNGQREYMGDMSRDALAERCVTLADEVERLREALAVEQAAGREARNRDREEEFGL